MARHDFSEEYPLIQHGELSVPYSAHVEWAEPAIVHHLKKGKRIFVPNQSLVIDKHQEETLSKKFKQLTDPKKTDDGIWFLVKKDLPVLLHYPGTSYGLHDIDADEVSITLFTDDSHKRDDLPESGNEINTICTIKTAKKNLKAHRREVYQPFEQALFPHPPKISDIKQGAMGDCFLLATLIAILSLDETEEEECPGQDFIQALLHQDVNNTTVQLHNPKLSNQRKHGSRTYVRVDNTFYRDKNGHRVNHSAPWVHMIEKAYAGFGMKPGKKVNPSFLEMYGRGGKPGFAMEVLTGQEADVVSWEPAPSLFDLTECALAQTMYLHSLPGEDDADPDPDPDPDPLNDVALRFYNNHQEDSKLFRLLTPEQVYQWGKFFSHKIAPNKEVFDSFTAYNASECSTDDLVELCVQIEALADKKEREGVREILDIIKNDLLPDGDENNIGEICGPRGSGIYTIKQQDLYSTLETAQGEKKIMVASSGNQHSIHGYIFAGGDVVEGLRSSHAYAIKGVKEKDIFGTPVKFVTLCNPWHSTGRVIEWLDAKTGEWSNRPIEDENQGTFDLELSEFTKYFHEVSIGQLPPRQDFGLAVPAAKERKSAREVVHEDFIQELESQIKKLRKEMKSCRFRRKHQLKRKLSKINGIKQIQDGLRRNSKLNISDTVSNVVDRGYFDLQAGFFSHRTKDICEKFIALEEQQLHVEIRRFF